MTKQITEHAQVAKLIRAELKKNGIGGTVRAKSYAGGSSVSVTLSDELPATVASVERFCAGFQAGHFDGMHDIYEYRKVSGPPVKFVFVRCDYSDEVRAAAWDYCRAYWAGMEDAPADFRKAGTFYCSQAGNVYGDQLIGRTLREARGGFWASRKQRVAA